MTFQNTISNIINNLTCPVSFEPLIHGVSLWPCNHKIQQYVAEKLYGEMASKRSVDEEKKCVLCNSIVLGFSADQTIRNLAGDLFSFKDPDKNLNVLYSHPSIFKDSVKKDTPDLFPGNQANFIYDSGSFDDIENSCISMNIKFKSSNKEYSLFKSFSIFSYPNGDLRVVITFYKDYCSKIKTFLELNDFVMDCLYEDRIICRVKEDIQKLSHILLNYNTIPEEYKDKIQAILDQGYFEQSVTQSPDFSQL